MKRIIYAALALCLTATSCSDFLETTPRDALSPSTTWKTAEDVDKFVVGCYEDWGNLWGVHLLYMDAASDIAYNNFPWEGWTVIGNGSWTESDTGSDLYDYGVIARCNNVVDNIDRATFPNEKVKNNLLGQALAIRAYSYMNMNFWYGGVPIIEHLFENAEAAKVPRNTEAEVWDFVNKDIDRAISLLDEKPAKYGRIAKGAALAIKMRASLYQGKWDEAAKAAKDIMILNQYRLDKNYANVFNVHQTSPEHIAVHSYDKTQRTLYTLGQFFNNGEGGWSSVVPTQALIDQYLMIDGQPKETSPLYDAAHPFANRDPRMSMTVLYPGCNFQGKVFNTLDQEIDGKKNPNYPTSADNASKTSLTWSKYVSSVVPADMWASPANIVVFRYAEVLLTRAEALNEKNGPSEEVYTLIDQLRQRVKMPLVDRAAYATQESLRELIRRERCVELAGEGLRRADIVRWKDSKGEMLAMTLLNGTLNRITGTVNAQESNPEKRATIAKSVAKIETRLFKPHYRYYPIPRKNRERNPKLTQNPGY
ncbi:MAG: RagB/SusD family nutrient uptake outer membrane protein [Bacteroidales bacterium]|nr:RagB/SusD family nutrient uptake outer membrane protein [Bacteroidales bacterium]